MVPAAVDARQLAGALLLSLAFGSIHAFSVLLQPLEQALQTGRTGVSLGYSIAIASLTGGVFCAARPPVLSPAAVALLSGTAAAAGVAIVAMTSSLLPYLIGYGLMFGFCNGVAYSLFLSRAAAAMPSAIGWSAGLVTAGYGVGAMIAAAIMESALQNHSLGTVLWGLAIVIGGAGAIAALLFRRAAPAMNATRAREPAPKIPVSRFWLVYFLGAFGGLLIIAHASGIAGERHAALAPMLVAFGNILGSLIGGPLVDRRAASVAFAMPLGLGGLAATLLMFESGWDLAALAACGFAYGTLISVVPVVLRQRAGDQGFAAAFGVVFTAWGVAGLLAPTAAGLAYDATSSYALPLGLAVIASFAGATLAVTGSLFSRAR